MSDDKKSTNSMNENGKVFNGELFVFNSNDIDYDANNNSLRKSTSNSNGGSLSNNIRGSMKSNQSNNERFLTNSLMQDLRGSSKKFSDKKIEFDKLKLKDQQNLLNNTELSNICNNNEDDILANIKLPNNEINNQIKQMEDYDLYEDVENIDNEDNQYEMEEIESNNMINTNQGEEMNEIININQLAKLNEFFMKNKKNMRKNIGIKGNELDEPLSLRSSCGSACISSHSNNSNGNMIMNMNMRSSKIFNKKEKNSPEKQIDNNSSGNLINLDEGNVINENDNSQNNSVDNNNNNIINEINDNSENKKEDKENKDDKENNKDKERKEKLAKIKDKNNEQNFISKNTVNFENKNINNVGEADKIELEMQLFNFESFLPKEDKEKEQLFNENLENDIDILKKYQNIIQNFEPPKQNEILKLDENKEEDKIIENEIKIEDDKIELPKEKVKEIEKEKINIKEMEKEEYVFEKFGKLGWECEKCNNFNFESRTICNRCEAPKQPKSLEQIKLENELKSGEKKKKPLVERKGDWQCPLCHNLNFAFRVSCNRCKLPKEIYLNYSMKQQKLNDTMNTMNNNINTINFQNNYMPQIPTTQIINNTAPQLIQNQFNIIQCGYLPMYQPYFPQNYFNHVPQPNTNNINNYKRKYKFYKQ